MHVGSGDMPPYILNLNHPYCVDNKRKTLGFSVKTQFYHETKQLNVSATLITIIRLIQRI